MHLPWPVLFALLPLAGATSASGSASARPAPALAPGSAVRSAAAAAAPRTRGAVLADTVASLSGRVVAAGTSEPVAGAEVAAVGTGRLARTDASGRFALGGLAPGPVLLEVRSGGGLKGSAGVTLAPGENAGAVVAIRLRPTALPDLEVEVRRDPDPAGRPAGFDLRRERRPGVFLDRAGIEASPARRTADLLRRMPGIRVEKHRWYHGLERIVMDRTPPSLQGPCPVEIYLDGNRLPGLRRFGYRRLDLDLPAPAEIEAVEVYDGAARVPARFAGGDARCGVIALWTRDPAGR